MVACKVWKKNLNFHNPEEIYNALIRLTHVPSRQLFMNISEELFFPSKQLQSDHFKRFADLATQVGGGVP